MDIALTQNLIEQLRRDVIGTPSWIEEKQVYEYTKQSLEVVVILKLVRATQGLAALHVLCGAGLFIDLGASIRSVNDSVEEIRFLLENYPAQPSGWAAQFVKAFFENTIDGYLDTETHQVPRDKIRSANVRLLRGAHDDTTQKILERIYKTFCGYTHANYAHIMEVYNGATDNFCLAGVPSLERREAWMQHVGLAANEVVMAAAFIAQKVGHDRIFSDLMKLVR